MGDAELRRLERRWKQTGAAADRLAYDTARRRHGRGGMVFVYRCHYEGPLGLRIVRLPDASSVLDWFQQAWIEVQAAKRGASDAVARKLVDRRLGGRVYGLDSIFRVAREQGLAAPDSNDQLEEALEAHLYVEGELVFDGETLRVLTDDDELQMAYYLFPERWAAMRPERVAFLLQEDWRLPTSTGSGPFEPGLELPELGPDGERDGVTYFVQFVVDDSGNLDDLAADRRALAIPGVRLPDLPDYLRGAEPDDWPDRLLALRAALAPRDRDLKKALTRCAAHPWELLAELGDESYEAMREALAQLGPRLVTRPAHRSKVACSPHLAQLCLHDPAGEYHPQQYQQWFLFDDLWAAGNPDLARSLLRCASTWDPLAEEVEGGDDLDDDDDDDD